MRYFTFLIVVFVFVSCSTNNEQPVAYELDLMRAPDPKKEGGSTQNIDKGSKAFSRKLIKDGIVEFETQEIEQTRKQILAAVAANNAYISSDQENKSADKISYTIIVRIPANRFDTFLNSATTGVRYFDNKQINVKDVTAEYFDTETRLKTKKEIEIRYLQLLGKADQVKDILAIEKEAGSIRTEIESAEGQLAFLKDQVQYSTLRINFYKNKSTPGVLSFQISSSFQKGWENLLAVCLSAIAVWPFIILSVGLWFIFKRFRGKLKKRTKSEVAV